MEHIWMNKVISMQIFAHRGKNIISKISIENNDYLTLKYSAAIAVQLAA